MGTRSLTVFKDRDTEICVMYRQFDGCPSGHGKELAEFLEPFVLVNGIRLDETRKIANGMSCLVAQVIAHFKNKSGVGGIYIYPAGTRDCGEDYIYFVYGKEGENPMIECFKSSETEPLFKSSAASMLKWLEAEEETEWNVA